MQAQYYFKKVVVEGILLALRLLHALAMEG